MVTPWPLTARSAELELLGDWYGDPGTGGALLSGPAGVGKSRLADEVLRLATGAGRPTARAIGHPATEPIPLGALAHLLPAELIGPLEFGVDQRAALFHLARAALVRQAGEGRLLLVVDDVDQLDATSLAVLVPLTVDRVVFVVATMRADRTVPASLAALLKEGHLRRLEVSPLDRDAVSTLLHRVLDGPMEADGVERLWTSSAGNLQMLTGLVGTALEQRALARAEEAGPWRLAALPLSGGLEEQVAAHLLGVGEDGRRALDLLALTGSLGIGELEAACDAEVLEGLEARRLLVVTTSGRRTEASLAHPLYGEVLRAQMPTLRRRALVRRLADRVELHGRRRREDLSRLARWRLEAGGDVDPDVLVGGARLALAGRDTDTAVRLARAAASGAPGDAAIVLAEAYEMLGRPAEVAAAMAEVWDRADLTDAQLAHLARKVTETRLAGERDVEGALRANDEAVDRVADPVTRASLIAHRSWVQANTGRPREALDTAARVPVVDDARVRVEVASARSTAYVSLGRSEAAVAEARAAQAAQADLPAWLAGRGTATHIINEAHAFAYVGHYDAAYELIEPAARRAAERGARAAGLWFEIVLGEIARDRGRGADCVRHFAGVASVAEEIGQAVALVWAHVGIAQGHLLLGAVEPAEAALRQADAVGDSPLAASSATRARTWAWYDAARGDLGAARRRLAAVGDELAEAGILVMEAGIRHDLVRFGDAPAAVPRLAELAEVVEGPLVVAMVDHARGVATGDGPLLGVALDRFEAIGALVLAAETAADLVAVEQRSGRARAAAATARRAAELVARVGGAATPALRRGTGAEPLTAREHEVALLAAGGLASKDIAARLVLSTRTVDTHLARVYRKLGVVGRGELRDALTALPPPP